MLQIYYQYYQFYDGNTLTAILKISESHYAILSHFKRNYDGVREKKNEEECRRILCMYSVNQELHILFIS